MEVPEDFGNSRVVNRGGSAALRTAASFLLITWPRSFPFVDCSAYGDAHCLMNRSARTDLRGSDGCRVQHVQQGRDRRADRTRIVRKADYRRLRRLHLRWLGHGPDYDGGDEAIASPVIRNLPASIAVRSVNAPAHRPAVVE